MLYFVTSFHFKSKDESSPSPPKKKFLQSTPDNENLKELNKETQTPIENIVSSTDIELFEQAKSKAVLVSIVLFVHIYFS